MTCNTFWARAGTGFLLDFNLKILHRLILELLCSQTRAAHPMGWRQEPKPFRLRGKKVSKTTRAARVSTGLWFGSKFILKTEFNKDQLSSTFKKDLHATAAHSRWVLLVFQFFLVSRHQPPLFGLEHCRAVCLTFKNIPHSFSSLFFLYPCS